MRDEYKRIIKIYIDRDAVLLEVAQRAYTIGEAVSGDERVRWLLQSVCDMGHKDLMERAISDAMELVYQAVSPYREVDVPATGGVEEVQTGVPQEYYFVLRLPERTPADIGSRVARLVHNVLVESCMAEWHNLMKQDASVSLMRVSRYAGDIKVLMASRIGIQRLID